MKQTYVVQWVTGANLPIKVTFKGKSKRHCPEDFVYGTGSYDDYTERYPNYVHARVWELYKANRK